jgi:SAM-dependent methyltransferase
MLSIVFKDYYQFLIDLVNGERTRAELSAAARRQSDCKAVFGDCNAPLEILDLGNGAMRPQTYILANQGHHVTGVDFVNWERLSLKGLAYKFARWLFRLHLPRLTRPRGEVRLVKADVSYLPFLDNSFDLITSCAAFEHFLEVDKVVAECQRVLKPRGMAWIMIHPFTCLSGGHNVGRRLRGVGDLPDGIEPWDHLRKRQNPFSVPLNQFRLKEYLEVFKTYFDVVVSQAEGSEGKHFLTQQLIDELRDFSEEELISSSFLIIVRKQI